jgi:hypothetical protein
MHASPLALLVPMPGSCHSPFLYAVTMMCANEFAN